MKNIRKSAEPKSLTDFKLKSPISWESIHLPENQSIYEDCILQCMEDQHNLCGYTEIKLNTQYHIDHFIKRSFEHRMIFEWENMIAAIHDGRFGADYKDNNIKRSEYNSQTKRYYHILSPVWDNLKNRFTFSTNGKISPASANDSDAIETITIFNLNEDSLCNRRKQAMNAARCMLQSHIPKEEIVRYLGDEFPSAVLYELNQTEYSSSPLTHDAQR